MATYRITAPDGNTYEITAPEGATEQDAVRFVQTNLHVGPQDRSGVIDGAVIDREGNTVYDPKTDRTENLNPTEGMSTYEKYRAGAQSKAAEYGQGIAQLFGADNQDSIAETQRINQPLEETAAGSAGRTTAALIPALAASATPGANTYLGASAIGAALGLAEPVEGDDVALGKLKNASSGAAFGFGGQLAGNTLAAALRGGKALIKPLFQSGQNELADAIIQAQAHDLKAAIQAAQAYMPATPGVIPTLAEATLDPGISGLQRAATGTAVPSRHLANRGVLVDALKNLAGTDAQKKAAIAARDAAAAPLYNASDAALVPTDQEFKALLSRPEVKAAWSRIVENAKNRGEPAPSLGYTPASRTMDGLNGWKETPESFGEISGADLHSLKMALDDALVPNPSRGIGKQDAKANKAARDAVLSWIEARIPEYGQARTTFRDLSKPIGQMDVGQALHDKLVPALSEAAQSNSRLAPSAYARAIRDQSEQIAQSATDFPMGGIEDVLTPSQMRTVEGISADLGREQAAYDSAMTRGSPTSKNLVTQNLIDQLSGSMGGGKLAQAIIRGALKIPSRVVDAATSPISDEINQKLAERLADSALGLKSLQYRPNSAATDKLAKALSRLGGPAALGIYSSQ